MESFAAFSTEAAAPHAQACISPLALLFISPSHNKLPDFSSSIANARVVGSFELALTGVLPEKNGVYSTKRNTATEIGKFLSNRRPYGRYPTITPHSVCCIWRGAGSPSRLLAILAPKWHYRSLGARHTLETAVVST